MNRILMIGALTAGLVAVGMAESASAGHAGCRSGYSIGGYSGYYASPSYYRGSYGGVGYYGHGYGHYGGYGGGQCIMKTGRSASLNTISVALPMIIRRRRLWV